MATVIIRRLLQLIPVVLLATALSSSWSVWRRGIRRNSNSGRARPEIRASSPHSGKSWDSTSRSPSSTRSGCGTPSPAISATLFESKTGPRVDRAEAGGDGGADRCRPDLRRRRRACARHDRRGPARCLDRPGHTRIGRLPVWRFRLTGWGSSSCSSSPSASSGSRLRVCYIHGDPLQNLKHLLLPALSLGLFEAAFFTRFLRAGLLEVLHQDYVRTANAKGLRGAEPSSRARAEKRADPDGDGAGTGAGHAGRRRGRHRAGLWLVRASGGWR